MPIDDALAQLGPSIKYPKIELTSTNGSYIFLPESDYNQNSLGYRYHPDLLVSKERKYLGKNWHQAHEELAKENSFMLTIRQFVDFLNLLKSGNVYDENRNKISDKETELILEDILAQRNPYRAEWLDAEFNTANSKIHINYHHLINRNLKREKEPLEDCLMQNKVPGIDLDYWLANATNSQGLPSKNNPNGKLNYYFPREGRVARFRANSVRVILDCIDGPLYSDVGLGVRPVKILE